MGRGQHAVAYGNQEWLEQHQWFAAVCERLFKDQPATLFNAALPNRGRR